MNITHGASSIGRPAQTEWKANDPTQIRQHLRRILAAGHARRRGGGRDGATACDMVVRVSLDDWLDSEEFYELCQQYRWAQDGVRRGPGALTAVEAFEQLKSHIRLHAIA